MGKQIKGYYLALLESNSSFPYSIHGLWPQYDKDHWPKCCSKEKFNLNNLKQLEQQLHADWHSSRGTDQHFWEHEWKVHGTCTGMTEFQYFEKALACFNKVKQKDRHWVQRYQVQNGSYMIPFDLNWQIGHLDF